MSNYDMLPEFPFGAVYFRKTNPPEEDWSRDYGTASEDGMNIFRHWFLWNAVEIEPGVWDWADYDRQLDLAAANGIKTVIAEMTTSAPEWAFRKYADSRYERRNGQKVESGISGSCGVGGFPGLCLDNEDMKAAAENWLRTLANRYKGHPGLGAYDVWNECNFQGDICYCDGTAAKFRLWLEAKYGDLRTLGNAWGRYSFATWEDIFPPRGLGQHPHVMDWLQFRIDNAYELMQWRVDLIRSIDPDVPIVAHGIAASLTKMASGAADDWIAASKAEAYGYTWGSSRHGDEPWKQPHAVDLVRASSRGKPFWHAESYAGPLWLAQNVLNKPRDEGRIASTDDIRYWNMASFMCGASGLLYLRWRPLLDGPLFGAFGGYGMDGSRTERSKMVSKVGKWATDPAQAKLWQSRPVKGEIGIVYVPETQIFDYSQNGKSDNYARSMEGAYQGFFDNNIQADWVHIDHIDEYSLLYLPFPVMLEEATANKLRDWVAAGGTLISEGCPAYFGDRGHVGQQQPNFGLDEVFGAKESYVEFVPDLLDEERFNFSGTQVWGGIYLQAYETAGGTAVGWYSDGRVAAVENQYGEGRTLLIGTMAGYGHGLHTPEGSAPFFKDLLAFGGQEQHVVSSDPQVKARMHDGDGGVHLWVANPTRQERPVRIEIGSAWGPFSSATTRWGAEVEVEGQTVELTCPARDATVIALT